MSEFLTSVINRLPAIRTRLQYGIGLLTILAFVFVQTGASTPVLPQIFIFAVVPLLIAMQLIARLPHTQQFVIILLITLMSLAFLATGVTLSVHDRVPQLQARYESSVYRPENSLNARYLVQQEENIKKVETYGDYRALILKVAKDDQSAELSRDLEAIAGFYEDYVECRSKWQCSASAKLDFSLVDFWYTYRPIIEERRLGFWGPNFAKQVQAYAEAIRRPLYLSAVRFNPATGANELVSTKPQFSPIKAGL
ncbi:hypothetical protein [Bradyrhizobium elkanii]|uniref:hypothetical protein n=1 Tax=Bradyrhizobium elkanii TaxID=29448 RepID=UPI0004B94472|nr:hypothetical protein [Bradyrhizobium elkanii]WLA83212.1 hypothetical protein QNJ99_02390 [Bradyrhizobium elkanii]